MEEKTIREKDYYKIRIKEMVDKIEDEDYLFGIYHFTKYKYEKENGASN